MMNQPFPFVFSSCCCLKVDRLLIDVQQNFRSKSIDYALCIADLGCFAHGRGLAERALVRRPRPRRLHPPRVAPRRGHLARGARRPAGRRHLQLAGRSSSTATSTSAGSPRRSSAACSRRAALPLEFPTISLGENLMKPTTMLFRNLMAMDVEECDPRLSARRGRAARRLRQDRAGAADGRAPAPTCRRSCSPAGRREPACFRGRELGAGTDLWHYVDGAARRADDAGGVRRARGGATSRRPATATRWAPPRRWPRSSRRSACPCRAPRRSRPSTRARARAAEATGRARGRARARGPAAVADPHRRGVRQRDHAADGARRRDERRRPPARARRPRRRAADARPLRRALAAHAGARERAAVGRAPVRGPPPRRRRAGACCASSRRCCTPTRSTVTGRTLGEEIAGRERRSTAT